MTTKFINRIKDLNFLNLFQSSPLLTIVGRRRLGKSALLHHWLNLPLHQQTERKLAQALEAHTSLQIEDCLQQIHPMVPQDLGLTSWKGIFAFLKQKKGPWKLALDEFPYLVASDPTLPSLLQRFIDLDLPPGGQIILSGSSFCMMHASILSESSPLYGRGTVLYLQPMGFEAMCAFLSFKPEASSFDIYSMVGGSPHYWRWIEAIGNDPLEVANQLFFNKLSPMENEIHRILGDEKIDQMTIKSVLDTIGRGASRPSEIASKLHVPINQLSRPLRRLMEARFIERRVPFLASDRAEKHAYYFISDPWLLFYYRVFLTHRHFWESYSKEKTIKIIRDHASLIFELTLRQSQNWHQYQDQFVEIDGIKKNQDGSFNIYEVKYKNVSPEEESVILFEKNKSILKSHLNSYNYKIYVIDQKKGLDLLTQAIQ